MKNNQNAKLLIILLGVIGLVGLYMGVYSPMEEERVAIQEETAVATVRLNELKEIEAKVPEYEEFISTAVNYIQREQQSYPSILLEEEALVWALDMEDSTGMEILSVDFNDPVIVRQFDGFVDTATPGDKMVYTASATTTTLNGGSSYLQMKNALDFVYHSTSRSSLESVTLSYDGETGGLSTMYEVVKYTLDFEGAEHNPVAMPNVAIGGHDSIFGTREAE